MKKNKRPDSNITFLEDEIFGVKPLVKVRPLGREVFEYAGKENRLPRVAPDGTNRPDPTPPMPQRPRQPRQTPAQRFQQQIPRLDDTWAILGFAFACLMTLILTYILNGS